MDYRLDSNQQRYSNSIVFNQLNYEVALFIGITFSCNCSA